MHPTAYQVWSSLSLTELFGRVKLTFDLLASNMVHIITRQVGNLPTSFGVSRTFRSRLISQHLSDASRDLATLTFDLGGHGSYRWCGSSFSVCVPSLKLTGLPVRKIWRTLNISRPGDLDLWPWNWCALLPVGWTTFPPILVFLVRFILHVSATTSQTRHVALRHWPLTLTLKQFWCF